MQSYPLQWPEGWPRTAFNLRDGESPIRRKLSLERGKEDLSLERGKEDLRFKEERKT